MLLDPVQLISVSGMDSLCGRKKMRPGDSRVDGESEP
jgi:hypothetical protein